MKAYSYDEDTTNKPQCECGNYVSRQFVRVFGTNDDVVTQCVECSTTREMKTGAFE